jgi:hypothetical protein
MKRSTAGVTLLEVLVAVTLLSFLTVGMSIAMRTGMQAFSKTNLKLMENRRVAGAQRILEQELEGLIPVQPPCVGAGTGNGQLSFVMFQAEPQIMRMVSSYSLQQSWRGQPQLLEFFVIPGEDGKGVRLVVNETPYTPYTAGMLCKGVGMDPQTQIAVPKLPPTVQTLPSSFVLADKLAFCRFSYFSATPDGSKPPAWRTYANGLGWPLAIRVEMAPLEVDRGTLQPITVTAPIRLHRSPSIQYVDQQ